MQCTECVGLNQPRAVWARTLAAGPRLPSAVFLMLAKTVPGEGEGERTSAPAVRSSAGNTSAARKIFEAR